MKLLWDAIGSEFGGRHELYEINYAGSHEDNRIQTLWAARRSGDLDKMTAFAEACMADYERTAGSGVRGFNRVDCARRRQEGPCRRCTRRTGASGA